MLANDHAKECPPGNTDDGGSCYARYVMIRTGPMRAYFNLRRGPDLIPDGEGVDVSDMSETLAELVGMLDSLKQDDPTNWAGWEISITVSCEGGGFVLLDSLCCDAEQLAAHPQRRRVLSH
jgi:hypothetical protein